MWQRVRNLQVIGLSAAPLGGGWSSVNDALWVRGYAGAQNVVDGVELRHLTDDYFNFHTSATFFDATASDTTGVVETADACLKVATWWWWARVGQQWGGFWAAVGDAVNLYDAEQRLLIQARFVGATFAAGGSFVACFVPPAVAAPRALCTTDACFHAAVANASFATVPCRSSRKLLPASLDNSHLLRLKVSKVLVRVLEHLHDSDSQAILYLVR